MDNIFLDLTSIIQRYKNINRKNYAKFPHEHVLVTGSQWTAIQFHKKTRAPDSKYSCGVLLPLYIKIPD